MGKYDIIKPLTFNRYRSKPSSELATIFAKAQSSQNGKTKKH